jgi:hypothetical protein
MNVHWGKSTNGSKGNLEQKFDVASGTNLELESVFKEASRNFVLILRSKKTV